jgi:WD40 repeat protein
LDPNSNFLPQAKIPGITDFKLQALSWAAHNDEVRLFGISLKGFLFEVDLERLAILNIEDVYGGAAWCLAPSPREPILAVGSESGIIRLFRYYSLKGLEYSKAISTSSARILSVAYHPNEPKLFTGSNDGTIRCIDEVGRWCRLQQVSYVFP